MSEETLLPTDVDTSQDQAAPPQAKTEESQSYAWFWENERQGEGEPPEWFKADKYKSVADQAKAYTEAEKRLGAFKGAPEEYDLKLPEGFELPEGVEVELDKEDPLLQEFLPWAKEHNLSQEAFQDIVGMYVKNQAEELQSTQSAEAAAAEQKELLGANADKRLSDLAKWGKQNLDADMFDKFASALTTAASVEAFEFVVAKTRNAPLPDPTNINPNLSASKQQELQELRAAKDESGKLKWFTDPIHRNKIEALQAEIYGHAPHREIKG